MMTELVLECMNGPIDEYSRSTLLRFMQDPGAWASRITIDTSEHLLLIELIEVPASATIIGCWYVIPETRAQSGDHIRKSVRK